MLSIVQISDRVPGFETISVHVGEDCYKQLLKPENVVTVQADSDELRRIFREIDSLPRSNRPVQTWYGDHAKYIAEHIRVYW